MLLYDPHFMNLPDPEKKTKNQESIKNLIGNYEFSDEKPEEKQKYLILSIKNLKKLINNESEFKKSGKEAIFRSRREALMYVVLEYSEGLFDRADMTIENKGDLNRLKGDLKVAKILKMKVEDLEAHIVELAASVTVLFFFLFYFILIIFFLLVNMLMINFLLFSINNHNVAIHYH